MEKSHVIVILAPACGRLEDFRDISFSLEQHVRRLHYFIGLLEEGHRQALEHDPLPPSFRADRLALGIDVPELDVVPFWSETADDGAVSIPFIEFIIAQIIWSIEGVAGEAGPSGPVSPDGLALAREALGAVLGRADPGGPSTIPLRTSPGCEMSSCRAESSRDSSAPEACCRRSPDNARRSSPRRGFSTTTLLRQAPCARRSTRRSPSSNTSGRGSRLRTRYASRGRSKK